MNLNIRRNCLFFWNLIDTLYFRFTRLNYVEDRDGKRTIMRVRLTKYKGRTLTLEDGTIIHKNDLLLKIHLHNAELLKQFQVYNNDIRRAMIIYKKVKDILPYLVQYLETTGYNDRVKGMIGITSLYKGCRKLGFEVYSIQNPYYKWFKQLALFSIHFISSSTLSKSMPEPRYLLMSKDTLYQKYFTS
ncbi:hypothetical protein AB4Y30_14655 [Ornithinibacillus sp. 4-3]|uniref:YkoP-like domain-containing protein n=1 Tax=Ornithinibacillus sp. 4-3 TaxID=3231488 RepID=A0AB39HNM0_9BACI